MPIAYYFFSRVKVATIPLRIALIAHGVLPTDALVPVETLQSIAVPSALLVGPGEELLIVLVAVWVLVPVAVETATPEVHWKVEHGEPHEFH